MRAEAELALPGQGEPHIVRFEFDLSLDYVIVEKAFVQLYRGEKLIRERAVPAALLKKLQHDPDIDQALYSHALENLPNA